MKGKLHQIVEQNLRYNLKEWKKKGSFDILNDVSENVALVQLLDTLGHVNNNTSILGYWIFESHYKKSLHLIRNLLDLICSPSYGEEQLVKIGFSLLRCYIPLLANKT